MHTRRVPGLVLILALSKAASAQPTVAFRVEVEPDPVLMRLVSSGHSAAKAERGRRLIDAFFLEAVASQGIVAFTRSISDKAISKLSKHTDPFLLRASDAALAEFATQAGALYGVHVLVSLDPVEDADGTGFRVLKLKARVVRHDRQVMVPPTEQSARLQTVSSEVLFTEFKAQAHQLLSTLNLSALSETVTGTSPPSPSPVANSRLGHAGESRDEASSDEVIGRPPATEGQRVTIVSPSADPGAGQRLWGKIGFGVGTGVAAIGAVVWIVAGSELARVKRDSYGVVETREDLQVALAGRQKQAAAIGLVAGGVALAGVGTALWALAPRTPVAITVGASPSGVALSIGGAFK